MQTGIWCFHYLISKLQLIWGQHDDVIINGQNSFRLDLIEREEAIAELVFFGADHFKRYCDFGPQCLCYREKEKKKTVS